MTVQEFRLLAESLYGENWKAAIEKQYGVSRRHLRNIAAGKYSIPQWLIATLEREESYAFNRD